MDHPILDALAAVLAPVPEEYRQEILALAKREIEERPLVEYCWDGLDRGEVDAHGALTRPWAYQIGQPSPVHPSHTVFCMFLVEEPGSPHSVHAFTFETMEVSGQQGVQFYREVIFEPKHVTGPLTPKALYSEFMAFLEEPEEGPAAGREPAAQNGSARA